MSTFETVTLLESQKLKCSHLLHFVVSLVFLPWLIVWIWKGTSTRDHNKKIQKQIDALMAMQVVKDGATEGQIAINEHNKKVAESEKQGFM